MVEKRTILGIFLGIFSFIGFTGIFVNEAFNLDWSVYVDSLFFILFGFMMFFYGGLRFAIKYIDEGFTPEELGKVALIIIGFVSIISGVLILFNVGTILTSVGKIVASLFALSVIGIDTGYDIYKKVTGK